MTKRERNDLIYLVAVSVCVFAFFTFMLFVRR
jgi:hypothetical protein